MNLLCAKRLLFKLQLTDCLSVCPSVRPTTNYNGCCPRDAQQQQLKLLTTTTTTTTDITGFTFTYHCCSCR